MKFSIDSKEIEFLNRFMKYPRVPRPGTIPSIPRRSGAYLQRDGDSLSIVYTPNRHMFSEFDEIKFSGKFDLAEVKETYEVSPIFLILLKSCDNVEIDVDALGVIAIKDKSGTFKSWNRAMKVSNIPGYFSGETTLPIECTKDLIEKSGLLHGKFQTMLDGVLVSFDPLSGSFAHTQLSVPHAASASFSKDLVPSLSKVANSMQYSIHCGHGVECLKASRNGYESKAVRRVSIPEDLEEKCVAAVKMTEMSPDLCEPIEVESRYMLTAIESALKMDLVPMVRVTTHNCRMECYFEADLQSVQFLGEFDIGGSEDYASWSVSPEPMLAALHGSEIVRIYLARSGKYVVCKYGTVSHIIPTSYKNREEAPTR